MYSIEELEKTFLKHAEQADKNHQEWIRSFKENSPGAPMPDHLTDNFNLPRAISSICTEILRLRCTGSK